MNEKDHRRISNIETILTKCLLIEYNYIQNYGPLGMYVLPQNDDMKTWNGVLMIKEGVYQKGVIKFKIKISNTYPSSHPKVFFTSKIYHPLINLETGELDICKNFPTWTPGKNLLLQLLQHIKEIFINPIYFQEINSFNPESGRLFVENYKEFESEVGKYCEQTYDERYNMSNFNIKTENINCPGSNLFLNKLSLLNRKSEMTMSEKLDDLKKWFMDIYVPNVKNSI